MHSFIRHDMLTSNGLSKKDGIIDPMEKYMYNLCVKKTWLKQVLSLVTKLNQSLLSKKKSLTKVWQTAKESFCYRYL